MVRVGVRKQFVKSSQDYRTTVSVMIFCPAYVTNAQYKRLKRELADASA